MASWLKAAEDLFEVVDRRAKLVVNELSDEQSDSQLSASEESQVKTAEPKARKSLSSSEPSKPSESTSEQTSIQRSLSDVTLDRVESSPPLLKDKIASSSSMLEEGNGKLKIVEKDAPSSAVTISTKENNHVPNHTEVPVTDTDGHAAVSTSNGELAGENSEAKEGPLLSPDTDSGAGDTRGDHPRDSSSSNDLGESGVSQKVDQEQNQLSVIGASSNGDTQVLKSNQSPIKVQEQLDEAQGLLSSAISTGQSKEARLARVCAGLSSRLQEYKSENAQLEELLTAERELCRSYEGHVKQLQQELSASKTELTRAESNMVEALAAKNSEIEALVHSMDALKKQAAFSEGKLGSLQANMESIMRNRELTETRMMQALREELASAERRAGEERAAHNATKMAAMEREVELEHRAVESSTALARIQRIADERTSKTAELEQKVAMLEVECASLNQELQDMEARSRRGQKKVPDEANQLIQIQAWQEDVEHSRQGQRDAESKLSSMEAEVQKMRVEMAAMKRDAEHYSRQEHIELEKRYRELTDLLYYKQTQLETMSSEKAAAEFQLEKELKRHQEAQVEAERGRVPRRASSSWEEEADLKALEPLPLHHRRLAGASIQLQKAAKLLDSGAVRITRFLWRYPTARVILLFYLVFVHLFLMYLLHRLQDLQEQADNFASREVEASMGLANSTLS